MTDTWWVRPEELDEDQKRVVSLPLGRNYLVTGPPGSGKSNLLLLRAAQLHRHGLQNLAVLAFGRVLREFMMSGAQENYVFARERVQTYVSWARQMLQIHGKEFQEHGDFPEVRDELLDKLKSIVESSKIENILDCILIDEVQDYSIEEIKVMSSFSNQIFAVGDSLQRIYETNSDDDSIDHLRKSCHEVVELKYHYRNGVQICRTADALERLLDSSDGMESSCQYNESRLPSKVEEIEDISLAEQVERCVSTVRTQMRAYQSGLIGILCPRKQELSEINRRLQQTDIAEHVQFQSSDQGYTSLDESKRVVCVTLHGAKGLEFRTVHLLSADLITRFRHQKRMAYTAITRAKTALTVYHERGLPGYLAKALAALKPQPVGPDSDLSGLFRGAMT